MTVAPMTVAVVQWSSAAVTVAAAPMAVSVALVAVGVGAAPRR